ncbi:MAG: hypothetical protein HC837_00415 [Chloroflexaceae bacterium]|nr:hypothetical protein [Chloroflexaceae bacterium]
MLPSSSTLAQQLSYLADEVEPAGSSSAERLRDLADAVENGPTAAVWAEANIFELIDAETIAEQVRTNGSRDNWVRWLEMMRNALVFLPIAVTWIGIALALESYTAAVQADPDIAGQSFLYLWQQGFGGRLWLTLSTIALVDGLLLGLVFVLTLIVQMQHHRRDRYAEMVRDELARLLADAALVLTARRSDQQSRLVQQFDRAAQQLMTELSHERVRIDELAKRKEKEVGDIAAFTRDFMSSTQGMLAAVQSLQQVPQQLGRNLTALSGSFQQLTDQQRDQHQEFSHSVQQAAAQLKQMSDAYRAASLDVQTMTTGLQTMGSQLNHMGIDLRDAVRVLHGVADQQEAAIGQTQTAARHLVEAQNQFLTALTHERGTLEHVAMELQTTSRDLPSAAQDLAQSVAQLTAQLAQASAHQQGLAEEMSRTTSQMASLLTATQRLQAQLTMLVRQQSGNRHGKPITSPLADQEN